MLVKGDTDGTMLCIALGQFPFYCWKLDLPANDFVYLVKNMDFASHFLLIQQKIICMIFTI